MTDLDDGDWRVRGLTMCTDADSGRWITDAVRNFEYDVGSLVPPVFEAYARIFHPATLHTGPGYDDQIPVRWQDVAAANGTVAHPVMEWGSIVGSWDLDGQPGLWDDDPDIGSFPAPQAHALAAVLAGFTNSPDACWFALCEILNALDVPPGIERLVMSARPMIVFRGPLAAADVRFSSFGHGASLWWPDDRAWCVATDVDLMSTYVGGSAACIRAVLECPDVEALPVLDTQRVTWDSDSVNPLPTPPSG
ncbi:hypothetical protein [Rhodococcus sp. AG1013]|uniref:hypothetical protein n=1 Tax=unclassified Rhodococcus (in: high G+C Gram-positive bacteria) TaxID=192944 RepID=UPI000E2E3E59|nr:hypothetical protein [Rhodococcus sp. AG1013]RDI35827.1 hypothetical protein DEU38_101307 [Rhodococcus sp. AG1013]